MEDISALEQRCMRIVAAADVQAKAARQVLESEVKYLRAELAEKEETYQIHMEQVDANLQLHLRNLQEITNQFLTAHRESTDLIRATAVEREEVETRALTHLKQVLYNFMTYTAWSRSREQRAAIHAFVKHFNNPSKLLVAKLKSSPSIEIRQLVRGAFTAIANESCEARDPEADFQAMSEFLDGKIELPAQDDALIGNALEAFLDKPGGMGRGAAAVVLPASTLALGGGAHAVVLYLLGAVDVLDRLGDKVMEAVLAFVKTLQNSRECFLLKEEREILEQHAKNVMSSAVTEVSDAPVQQLLMEQVISAAQERMSSITSLVRNELESTNTTLAGQIRLARNELWNSVLPIVTDGLFMNEIQFRARVLATTRADRMVSGVAFPSTEGGVTSSAPPPPVVVSALYRASSQGSGLLDKIMIHFQEEQQKTLRRVHTEMALQMDKIMRTANTQRNIVVEQHVTEMRLDDVRADIHHQQFMRSMILEREAKLSTRADRDMHELRSENERLRAALEKAQKENEALEKRCAMAEAETTLLREVAAHRQRSADALVAVQQDTRVVNYVVNQGTFGETWQESLLRLRERILGELSSDNARFLAKLRSFLKRKEVDHAKIEQLYETRLHTTVKHINEEHEARIQHLRKRSELEIAALRDNHVATVSSLNEAADREKTRLCDHYEESYLQRVKEMNDLYSQRLRQLASREKEWEDRLTVANRRLREQFRRRENELENKLSDRQEEMRSVFDEDSLRVKEQFAQRHKELERSHLQATARLEAQLNERSQAVQKQFEALSLRLQEDVLRFVGEKQSFFDTFRANELDVMASFMHEKERMTAIKYENMLAAQLKRSAEEIADLRADTQLELGTAKEAHEAQIQQVFAELDQRLKLKASNVDHTFHVAQELHIKKSDAFWDRCREYLIRGEESLAQRKTAVEIEIQQRYNNLVDQCQLFLSRDMVAARESFSAELTQRYDAIHASCKPLQSSTTLLQHELWEELHRRHFLVGQEAVERAYMLSMCDEGRMFVQRQLFFASLRESGNIIGECASVADVRLLREKFDIRLAEEHAYVANLTRDTITSLEVGLEATYSATTQFQESQRQQMSDVARILQQKQEMFDAVRSKHIHEKYSTMLELLNAPQRPQALVEHKASGVGIVEHLSSVNRLFSDTVSHASQRWEADLQLIDARSRKRMKEAFNSMHEEYVSAVTSLMQKLELSQTENYAMTQRHAVAETTIDSQARELQHAIFLLKHDHPSLDRNLTPGSSHLKLDDLRQAALAREIQFTSDLWASP
jgi:hypothetical protein